MHWPLRRGIRQSHLPSTAPDGERERLTRDLDAFGVVSLDRAVLQRFVQEAQDGERSTLLRSSRRHLWSMSTSSVE